MKIRIECLTDKNSPYLKIITNWMYEWWDSSYNFSKEKSKSYMEYSLCKDRIPQTYIMLLGDKVIGMYQFQNVDLDIRPDIYPWLTNIYILPEYRGLGYSKILLESVKENAKKIGLKELYLYTSHIGLYEKYDFKFIYEIETQEIDNPIQRLYKLEI